MPSQCKVWCNFDWFSMGNGSMLAPTSNQKSMSTSKGRSCKILWKTHTKINEFSSFSGRSWHQKTIKNQLKKELNLERPLGIDFSWNLVDFGGRDEPSWHGKSSQNRSKNRLKTNWKKEDILEASRRRLGTSWKAKIPRLALEALVPRRGGGYAEAPP